LQSTSDHPEAQLLHENNQKINEHELINKLMSIQNLGKVWKCKKAVQFWLEWFL